MSGASSKVAGKLTRRVLRALSGGNGDLTPLPAVPGSMLLCAGDAKVAVTQTQLAALRTDGLIAWEGSAVRLRPEGRSWLRRQGDAPPGDAMAAQHRQLTTRSIDMSSGRQSVTVNLEESPLMRLATRKGANGAPYLDAPAVEAGERLRRDFTLGGLSQRITMSWDASAGKAHLKGTAGGAGDLMDGAIDARRRVDEALQHVGPELAGVLTDVCCELKGLERVERERRWPPRSAKLVLRIALTLLSRHYGTVVGQGRGRPGLRTWHAPA